MSIKNIEGLTGDEIRDLVARGGKFVMYKYCISVIIMTFNRPSDFYFIHPGKSSITPGLGYLFVSLFLGWWGIPWGPIYTIGNIGSILGGGKDYTNEILAHINQNDPTYGAGATYNIPAHIQSANPETANTYNIPQ
ncbi:hypothetical protein [Pedobacter roseus]|jgi:hypothetical protein|uniref:Uncharacterized protein n=1 Tax=Pedobacter roseus TaxID=336820 RepID=A0A7G9QJ59_9SPHI|nr:hypothetical protein [Pedobacter roseus]QNN43384.1 hypothetical protein H9L23_04580 [Pedobacter roseus]